MKNKLLTIFTLSSIFSIMQPTTSESQVGTDNLKVGSIPLNFYPLPTTMERLQLLRDKKTEMTCFGILLKLHEIKRLDPSNLTDEKKAFIAAAQPKLDEYFQFFQCSKHQKIIEESFVLDQKINELKSTENDNLSFEEIAHIDQQKQECWQIATKFQRRNKEFAEAFGLTKREFCELVNSWDRELEKEFRLAESKN